MSIDVQVQLFNLTQLKVQINLNREKLRRILKTVSLCGQQNVALRGHKDEQVMTLLRVKIEISTVT